jgi:hypothetical protein
MTHKELQAHLVSGSTFTYLDGYRYKIFRMSAPPIYCADGFKLSVQASHNRCSTPKNLKGPYTYVEVGFPSEVEPLILEWANEKDSPTDTIYPYVPTDVVLAVINNHGGVR